MISFLKGTLEAKTLASAYLDVNGVGFEVGMSQTALSKLPEIGQPVQVFTYLQVRDDGMSLYGFLGAEEKALFEKLIGVSGVGPKMALAALSTYSAEALLGIIAEQDVAAVQRIPGVGKKTASRIILELKGSLEQGMSSLFSPREQPQGENPALAGAREALLSMGFTSAEADLALKGASEDADEGALLQYALKRLGQ
jgi:holliday junction DNA helicase RuvA